MMMEATEFLRCSEIKNSWECFGEKKFQLSKTNKLPFANCIQTDFGQILATFLNWRVFSQLSVTLSSTAGQWQLRAVFVT